jgi:carbamoyl-phosphate synthase small subunit
MKRYLVLENGQVFEGYAFGADTGCVGELVFTTGMNGYIETLTGPSYFGQIVMQTFPLIGNYGVISEDYEGKCCVKGYVVREWCEHPSNFRSEKSLDLFLKETGVPGIYGVDTRALTKIIRESGVMNARICDQVPEDLSSVQNYRITDAVTSVTSSPAKIYTPESGIQYRVALIDYGAKRNIIRELLSRGCEVTSFPCTVSAEEILNGGFHGIMLSNGPGDPADNHDQIEEIAKLFGRIPIFGIGLGHQLLALSQNGRTVKLKYGHRGANQPVKELESGRTFITSQNHGYAVVSDSVKNGKISYVNANDNTCEGITYDNQKAFSVQFHPEACSGPHDTAFLFDKFCEMMGGNNHAAR